jgi:hypothetical protein
MGISATFEVDDAMRRAAETEITITVEVDDEMRRAIERFKGWRETTKEKIASAIEQLMTHELQRIRDDYREQEVWIRVGEWNKKHEIGTPVVFHPIIGASSGTETKTLSAAWVAPSGVPVIRVASKANYVALEAVSVAGEK